MVGKRWVLLSELQVYTTEGAGRVKEQSFDGGLVGSIHVTYPTCTYALLCARWRRSRTLVILRYRTVQMNACALHRPCRVLCMIYSTGVRALTSVSTSTLQVIEY